jgi:hypothetical protein
MIPVMLLVIMRVDLTGDFENDEENHYARVDLYLFNSDSERDFDLD